MRYKSKFSHIPLVLTTKTESDGLTGELAKALMKEIEFLTNTGIEVLSNEVKTILKVILISITGDIMALNKMTETLNSVSHHPCLYCKVRSKKRKIFLKDSFHTNNAITSNVAEQDYLKELIGEVNCTLADISIKTDLWRKLVSTGQFVDVSGWRIKAIPLVTYHSTLDISRVLCPDLMHTSYENIFAKRICGVLSKGEMRSLDLILHKIVLERKTATVGYFASTHLFEDAKELAKDFTPAMMKTNYKAVDIKALSHLLSFYFIPLKPYIENNENCYIELLKLLLEYSSYLIAFASLGVPSEILHNSTGSNPLKDSYIALIIKIEEKLAQPGFEWLELLFCLPSHQLLHLFDKWRDFGSFKDNWCFGTERACNRVRNLIRVGANACKSLNKRLSVLTLENCLTIGGLESDNLSCYEWGRSRKIKTLGELQSKLAEIQEKFGPLVGSVVTRDLTFCKSRSTRIDTEGVDNHAKLFVNGGWLYLKISRLVLFEIGSEKFLLMKYRKVSVHSTWIPTVQKVFDFAFYSRVIHEDEQDQWLWLNDSVELFGISVLTDYDNVIVDKHPEFHLIFRKHE